MKKALAVAFSLLMLSCGQSTKITNSWKDPKVTNASLQKIMLLTMIENNNKALQHSIEQQLASSLALEGFYTVSSYVVNGPTGFGTAKEKQALQKLRSNGIDGVLTINLRLPEDSKISKGDTTSYASFANYPRFWHYYKKNFNKKNAGNTTNSLNNYSIETNLYNITTNKIIYTSETGNVKPLEDKELPVEYAKSIVKDMKQRQLLKSSKTK